MHAGSAYFYKRKQKKNNNINFQLDKDVHISFTSCKIMTTICSSLHNRSKRVESKFMNGIDVRPAILVEISFFLIRLPFLRERRDHDTLIGKPFRIMIGNINKMITTPSAIELIADIAHRQWL